MKDYAQTNIFLREKSKLEDVKTWLECNGKFYYQNASGNLRKFHQEYHYFLGNSVVFIKEFSQWTDIQIISDTSDSKDRLKENLEKILNGQPEA